ncbi:hypothetical protein IFM89_019043 [Coptis chinensis]|uniref:AAA+ ATPase domain-containing protein n=1 Tax=Coptis chinensis TaxID=261450 RepID=A0A835J0U8_9MAGN|nr:hypothetical protein IFM89_019043 [Coptis chinensis]
MVKKLISKLKTILFPRISITIDEQHLKDSWRRNKLYPLAETYLRAIATAKASKLKASSGKGGETVALTMGDNEDITDVFEGAVVRWGYRCIQSENNHNRRSNGGDKYYYKLKFDHCNRDLVQGKYMKHVAETGRAIILKNRKRKLYTNSTDDDEDWTPMTFKHPATFGTLGMDPTKKKEIMDDLLTFSKSKDYYNKIGKAWKRGYLLYGPPGTGKSTMIAAIANFLDYDIYDLELTAVKNNISLRRLLSNTTDKSVLVIEDIDCSLGLAGERKSLKPVKEKDVEESDKDDAPFTLSQVTLSGLLNFIDGLWTASGEERIVVFTTNHVEKLDPALIRRGHLDSHPLFEEVGNLLENTEITPADVAEVLISKGTNTTNYQLATERLEELIEVLKKDPEEKEKG